MQRTTQGRIEGNILDGTGPLVPRGRSSLLRYRRADFDFAGVVAAMLETADLECVGVGEPLPLRTRATDQATRWHRLFYDRFSQLRPVYEQFIRGVVARLFRDPFYYQAVPTFRIQLPDNTAVGEFHVDRTYGHPEAELNFWIPLTTARHTSSIWLESAPGRGDFASVDARPGDMLVFDATHLHHGNRVNETGKTRVSFDFRCLRVADYRETDQRSINAQLPFAPGGYFAATPVEAVRLPDLASSVPDLRHDESDPDRRARVARVLAEGS